MEFIVLHRAAKNITGNRYGRLVAVGPVFIKKFASGANHVHWLCRCDCGKEKTVSIGKLSTGNTKSCGCLQREHYDQCGGIPTHGRSGTYVYNAWRSMLKRCQNPRSRNYGLYGGRGITVCERWKAFENFLADMGERPTAKHSLDRRDNSGNYEPFNCKWSLPTEQQRNMRTNRIVTAFGRTEPLVAFVENERHYNRTLNRINRGWDVERAILQPPSNNGPVASYDYSDSFWQK